MLCNSYRVATDRMCNFAATRTRRRIPDVVFLFSVLLCIAIILTFHKSSVISYSLAVRIYVQ